MASAQQGGNIPTAISCLRDYISRRRISDPSVPQLFPARNRSKALPFRNGRLNFFALAPTPAQQAIVAGHGLAVHSGILQTSDPRSFCACPRHGCAPGILSRSPECRWYDFLRRSWPGDLSAAYTVSVGVESLHRISHAG